MKFCSDVLNRVWTPKIKMFSDVYIRVGTPHIEMCLDLHTRVGTTHIEMCSDVHTKVGTPHIEMCSDVHTRVGTPHIEIPRCSYWGGDTAQISKLMRWDGWVGGWVYYSDNNATSWLHLASWNLPDSQLD